MKIIKLVIVDDHKMIRDGLKAILRDNATTEVVADFSSGDELMHFLEKNEADFIILDMHMPLKDGIEVAREVKSKFPKLKILINTMSELSSEIENAMEAGVNGYILKASGSEELFKAIAIISEGDNYFGSAVLNSYIRNIDKGRSPKKLTPAELKIINLLYREKKQETITEELGIAKGTFMNHLQSIYRKLNVKTEVGVIKYALKNNLINEEVK